MKIKKLRIIVPIIFAIILYYVMLPPLNLSCPNFWLYLMLVACSYVFITTVTIVDFQSRKINTPKSAGIVIGIGGGILLIIIMINLIISPLFISKKYYNRIKVDEETNFSNDIEEVDFTKLPLLDKESSRKLGDRVMGQMPELVSQFYVSDLYTQINYDNNIIRVTPLEYGGLIKWFTNKKSGVKGYITVNSVNGETKLTKLEKGMQYMPSSYFSKDLNRKLRFSYPCTIFDTPNFELDNEGNPYWIVPTVKYYGIGQIKEIVGAVILDPITGESKKYDLEQIPSWVDHVYSADLIIDQVDDWGQYKNGFLNSLFGQKNVVATTDGYNYLIMNDDVFLYTGITSKASDESNIGFILVNMRTKDTNYYAVPGAEEYSAMDSAEGQVQQMEYEATFPLLINLNGKPTYLMSLKDNAGLVKMYAFVDVEDYQKVVVTDSSKGIEKASENYISEVPDTVKDNKKTEKITISQVKTAVIDGTTYYYFVDTNGEKYKCSINVEKNKLPFIVSGDIITITYKNKKDVTDIVGLE